MTPGKLKTLLFFPLFLVLVSPALAQPKAKAMVLGITDGDTLKVDFQGRKESVRLIGIDCPESRTNPKAKKNVERSGQDIKAIITMGKRATAFTKSLVKKGDRVRIEFDVQQRDKYRRLLGYVYLADGRMLNEEIVRTGYASLFDLSPECQV